MLLVGLLAAAIGAGESSAPSSSPAPARDSAPFHEFIESNCLGCHDHDGKSGGLALDDLMATDVERNPEAWEHVVRKLTTRQMPPLDAERPAESEYDAAVAHLDSTLDAAAAARPNPGRTETFRRLTRTEYQNAIRDLLGLEIDAGALLPEDESSQGFDNITVADLSPTLVSRYVTAAQTISRLAVGREPQAPEEFVYRIQPDVTQDSHVEGLPLGTRGGALFTYNFPQDGRYEVRVRLMRDRNDEVESLTRPHELDVLVDRRRIERFTVEPPRDGATHASVDAHLVVRFTSTAGPHQVGIAFVDQGDSLVETIQQPLNVHFNFYRHPRLGPAVYQASVIGPFRSLSESRLSEGGQAQFAPKTAQIEPDPGGSRIGSKATGPGDAPSRRRLFIDTPTGADDEEPCAARILAAVIRRAYRRPVEDEDLETPLGLFREARADGNFDAGIEAALSAVLVNPRFLFRIERDPRDARPGTAYAIDDFELASRLSFFLWSSIPDDELLDLAERGEVRRPEILGQQARRMLADERSRSLVVNFADQWLYLRNLDAVSPDMRLFPDFDDNLRQAMRQETELFFESIVREDRSVLDLIRADDTFLNERLAKHYGIPHVYGSRFRRVQLDEGSRRGGLLRHGSILAVTSYATRTSPVLRGHWVLKNLVGAPPPPPPPGVPALEENTFDSTLSVRERLQQHRADEACAACHNAMDPLGFALENFDAVGRWRDVEFGDPVDAAGAFLDGREFVGPAGLEQALLDRPELFVGTLTEKLLTFALGRGVEYYDAPAVRKIVAAARDSNYRFSALVDGIVASTPFQMRMTE
jgi:hypothetical protein